MTKDNISYVYEKLRPARNAIDYALRCSPSEKLATQLIQAQTGIQLALCALSIEEPQDKKEDEN